MYLKRKIKVEFNGFRSVTIPLGTKVKPAHNQPENKYWIVFTSEQIHRLFTEDETTDRLLFEDHYHSLGFLVDASEVYDPENEPYGDYVERKLFNIKDKLAEALNRDDIAFMANHTDEHIYKPLLKCLFTDKEDDFREFLRIWIKGL